jgi:putative transposase
VIIYIDEHRRSFGVEPICRTLAVAPSSYYAARVRPASARSIRDAALKS